jgi:O-antigen ligase
MPSNNLKSYLNFFPDFCVIMLFFVTPISSSAKSIFLAILVICTLLIPEKRQALFCLLSKKSCFFLLLLFFIALIASIWSDASIKEIGLVLEKWSKLLYLPFLILALNNKNTRKLSFNAFLVAMLITSLLSFYLFYTHDLGFGKMKADGVFRNHIMTGIMMSFATYLAAIFFTTSSTKYLKAFYLTIGIIFTYQVIFINESRTGYLMFLLLTSLFMFQHLTKRNAFIAILALTTVFATCCYVSQPLYNRIRLVYTNLHNYNDDKNTPVGYRIQFHDYAKKLFYKHPLVGNGTGSFTYSFRIDNPVPAWTDDKSHSGRLLEPHSQYWLIAAEFGMLGILTLMIFYGQLLSAFCKLTTLRPIALALFAVLVIGNFTDSLLFYSGSGYFFILFFALFLNEAGLNNSTQRA